MAAAILSIQVGRPEITTGASPASQSGERSWTTGFGKQPVAGSIRLHKDHFDGDAQADLKHHGGPDKAVCVYAGSLIFECLKKATSWLM